MSRDFTFSRYAELLDAGRAAGYRFLTLRDYLGASELPDRFVILRHDVDRKPENSLKSARIEAERDVRSTYYVRTTEETFRPRLLRELEELGHEVGYHYEDMDRADGDVERAHASFTRHLERLRTHCTVDTVCMHGNPLTPHDNRDMWTGTYEFGDYDLLGEAYLSVDFTDVTYYSDTGRTWRDGVLKIKDHTRGEGTKSVEVDTTSELQSLLGSGRIRRVYLLSHPNRWADDRLEFVVENVKDRSINAVKRGLVLLR